MNPHPTSSQAQSRQELYTDVSFLPQNEKNRDFPGGAVVKNLPADAGDTGSSPGPGGSHMPRSH